MGSFGKDIECDGKLEKGELENLEPSRFTLRANLIVVDFVMCLL
jgi:hypothetical protein